MHNSQDLNLTRWDLFQLTRSIANNSKENDPQHISFLIQKAFYLAKHFDNKYPASSNTSLRSSQDSLQVAMIAAMEMALELSAILAAILYTPFLEDFVQKETIIAQFGAKTGAILEELKILAHCKIQDDTIQRYANHLDNTSPHILAILLQLADIVRLYCSGFITKYGQDILTSLPNATTTQVLSALKTFYIPLSHRMRLYDIQTRLADFWFKHTNTLQYYYISAKLGMSKLQRQKKLETISQEISHTIQQHNIAFTLKNRIKSVYSIWNKMQRLNVNFEKIYDLTAIRIIVSSMQYNNIQEEKIACWKIFSILSHLYTPKYDIMRDWISIPKDSGYESLHLTLKTKQDELFEVQIRTERMDHIAEYGKAAHWKYKQ